MTPSDQITTQITTASAISMELEDKIRTHRAEIGIIGLGSLMTRQEGQSWDPRRDGLAVRATAVASARPALRVGAPPRQGGTWLPDQSMSAGPILGTFPFALSLEAWNGLGLKDVARRAAREAEHGVIKQVLEEVRWNRMEAARRLKISYKALLYKIQECGL